MSFVSFSKRVSVMGAATLVGLASLVGCGFSEAAFRTGDAASRPLPAISPANVKFYGELPDANAYQEVGLVVAVADVDEPWMAMGRLRRAAANLGADAVIQLRFDIVQSNVLVAKGIAVVMNKPNQISTDSASPVPARTNGAVSRPAPQPTGPATTEVPLPPASSGSVPLQLKTDPSVESSNQPHAIPGPSEKGAE